MAGKVTLLFSGPLKDILYSLGFDAVPDRVEMSRLAVRRSGLARSDVLSPRGDRVIPVEIPSLGVTVLACITRTPRLGKLGFWVAWPFVDSNDPFPRIQKPDGA